MLTNVPLLSIAVAILDSDLVCSASVPCPAEMSASIHIKGTGSIIIDTALACRSTGVIPRRWVTHSPQEIAALVLEDAQKESTANVGATQGSPVLPECAQRHENIVRKALSATWEK